MRSVMISTGCSIGELEIGGHDSPAQPHSGEASVLGKGVHLDGHVLGTLNLVD